MEKMMVSTFSPCPQYFQKLFPKLLSDKRLRKEYRAKMTCDYLHEQSLYNTNDKTTKSIHSQKSTSIAIVKKNEARYTSSPCFA